MGNTLEIKHTTVSYIMNDVTSECKVKFSVQINIPLNCELRVSGTNTALGEWNPYNSLHLELNGSEYEGVIDMTCKQLEYRFVLITHDYKEKWERNSRMLTYPKLGSFMILNDNQKVSFSQDYRTTILEVSFNKQIPSWLSLYLCGNTNDLGNEVLENGCILKLENGQWTGRFSIKTQNIINRQSVEYQYFIDDTHTAHHLNCVKEVGPKHIFKPNHAQLKFCDIEFQQYKKAENNQIYFSYLKPKYEFLISIGTDTR